MIVDYLEKWDDRYLVLAAHVSHWSKDPSTQTGAVIVSPRNRLVSLGFNGFPEGIADDERLADRALKLELITHCEVNALVSAARDLHGCTLYTWPLLSCSRCASIMIQAGITRAVAPLNTIERWTENLKLSRKLFEEAGVEILEVRS